MKKTGQRDCIENTDEMDETGRYKMNKMDKMDKMKKGARFSEDRKYRYFLYRIWDNNKEKCLFIGLNPSTADETEDDPTIRRCIGFARDWGFGGLLMANLFAYRATDPENLGLVDDPVGPDNDKWLRTLARKATMIVAAWGVKGTLMQRDDAVKSMIEKIKPMKVLGVTKKGLPRHPLYMKKDSVLQDWN